MTLLDKTLMLELADSMTRVGTPVSADIMSESLDPGSEDYRDLRAQYSTGRVRTVWSVDQARNFWRPTVPDLWNMPYEGFVGTAVGLYQPAPYLIAWMGNHKPWMDRYRKGEDLFSSIADDLSMGREQGREAFYRYVYGLPQPYVENRYPWLAALREGMRERAATVGFVETSFGSRYQVHNLDMSLGHYLDQVVRDILRVGILTLYREYGYMPYAIFPDSVVVPHRLCAEYAEAFQQASRDRFLFSVVMERLQS